MLALADFLANMSHSIRTPMNGLLGTVQLLRDSAVLPAQREYLETMPNCGATLLQLVNDSLDLAKVESGKLTLESTPFSSSVISPKPSTTPAASIAPGGRKRISLHPNPGNNVVNQKVAVRLLERMGHHVEVDARHGRVRRCPRHSLLAPRPPSAYRVLETVSPTYVV